MKILIVDDFLDSLLVTESAILDMDYGLDVCTAQSAIEAFKLLGVDDTVCHTPGIDLVLMDIDMPEINGVEACRTIKAKTDLRDIPIIMVTSFEDVSYVEEAFAAGAMDYVTKPVNRVQLGARVRSALSLKKETDSRKIAYDELQKESLAKTQILSTVTHELRTPLTGIMGYVGMLLFRQETVGTLNDRQQKYLEYIQEDSEMLKALIEDLLDISKLEAGSFRLNPSEIDVRAEVEHVLRSLHNQFAEKELQSSLDIPISLPAITADQLRFSQVLTNLISNAFKYSPAGTSVTITAQSTNGWLKLGVSDSGMGISSDDQPLLFTKFFRADNSTTRNVSGSGLGLYITKMVVEAQGGHVFVDSNPGVGSTFSFTLPIADCVVAGAEK